MLSLPGCVVSGQVARRCSLGQPCFWRLCSTATSILDAGNAESIGIRVPFRKERGPTDILAALEKTVSRDFGAPDYKFQDDPFLTPVSNRGKRSFALAKESGRKAAMWVHSEYSLLFNRKLSEPRIEAFLPKATYKEGDHVSEEMLMNAIRRASVSDAMAIYELLGEGVSVETKQALLELLCYHNSQEQLHDDLIEERWYRKSANRQRQIWKSNPKLDELFEFLISQDGPVANAAYNTMICGTAKYLKVDRAWALFEECEHKNIPLNLEAYNYLIQLIPVMRDGLQERRSLLFELLGKINDAGLSPNVRTLNFAMRVAITISPQAAAQDLTRQLFSEFKNLGVEPSLASYYFALVVFCKDRGPKSEILREIMDEIEGKVFTMHDPSDTYFFVTAMDVARNHLNDNLLADRIHKLLLTGDNYHFIGESLKESIYYRHYTVVLLKNLPFEEFMKWYDTMVPNVYIPEPSVLLEIVDAMELAEPTVVEYALPRLWSHVITFEQLDREKLILKLFNLMRAKFPPAEDSSLNAYYAEAASAYWDFVEEQNTFRQNRINWNGKLLADMAILSLRGDRFERCLEILALLVREQNFITGIADIEHLTIIFDACLERGHTVGALDALKYSAEVGFVEAISMAQKIRANLPLSLEQDLMLTNLMGSDSFELPNQSEELEITPNKIVEHRGIE